MSANQMGALLLGAAIRKVFPHAQYEGSSVDSHYFYATLFDDISFDPNFLPLLETAMKSLLKQEHTEMEMLSTNAKEFFLHHGEKKLADTVSKQVGLVTVVQIEKYWGWCLEKPLEDIHFALLTHQQKKKEITITGIGFATQKLQKTFLKKHQLYHKANHLYFASQLHLYDKEDWYPRGMLLKQVVLQCWRDFLEKANIFQVQTPDPKAYFLKTNCHAFSCLQEEQDFIHWFASFDIPAVVLLMKQWVEKFFAISEWVLYSPSAKSPLKQALDSLKIAYTPYPASSGYLEIKVADALGFMKVVCQCSLEKGKMTFSLFGNLEEFISLILENSKGQLPFWLSPYQAHLLPLEGIEGKELIEIFTRQKLRVFVNREKSSLSEKIHLALRLKVPYVMVLGKKEESARQVTLRTCGSSLEEIMTFEKVEKILLSERKFESQ